MIHDANKVVAQNSGLVYKQLHKFGLIKDQEAESIAFEALYNAILSFESEKNIRFSTFATVCIYNALGSYSRTLNKQRQLTVISYNALSVDEDGNEHEMLEVLSDESSVDEVYFRKETCGIVRQVFNECFDSLTNEKHRHIVNVWNEADYDISTSEIAKVVGVSQSYVSQVLNVFKHKLRVHLGVHSARSRSRY